MVIIQVINEITTSNGQTTEHSTNATTSDSGAISNDDNSDKPSAETIRNAGLIRIWIAMQNTLCGFSTVNEENISKLSRDIRIGTSYSWTSSK